MKIENHDAGKGRLERLAWLLDSSIPLPGTNFRVGLDGVIGLIPGIGDAVGGVLSSYIIAEAARMGVPKTILIRMGFNVIVETVVGMIPIVGDVFDFAWKANNRNVALLRNHLGNPRRTDTRNRVFVIVLGVVLFAVIIGIIALGVLLIAALVRALSG